jgi:superoxide dismutase, Cu-Zn family
LTRYSRSSRSVIAAALALGGCAAARTAPAPASAVIADAQGTTIGTAYLTANADHSVTIRLDARNLPPGPHGIHFHAVGACDRPAFTTAGAHFNPAARMHGLDNQAGPHNGDLPNLIADAKGQATYSATTDRVTITPGPTSLLDQDLSAIVIHAAADDQKTDPAGNSGARLACGIVLIPQR